MPFAIETKWILMNGKILSGARAILENVLIIKWFVSIVLFNIIGRPEHAVARDSLCVKLIYRNPARIM